MAKYAGGYIKDGVYIPSRVDPSTLQSSGNSRFKDSDQDRQRKDFSREIIQPFDAAGRPNEDFINAYPEESRERGFIPTIDQIKEDQ